MKYLLCLFLALGLGACSKISPKGDLLKQEISIEDFEKISLKGNFKVFYIKTPKTFLSIETYPNILDNLDIKVENNTLYISEKRETKDVDFCNINLYSKKNLSHIELRGASELNISSQIMSDDFHLKMSDRTRLNAALLANKAALEISENAQLKMLGKVLDAKITISDSASITSPYWFVSRLNINAKDHSFTELSVEEKLKGSLFDDAKLIYHGEPSKKITQEDQSTLIKK